MFEKKVVVHQGKPKINKSITKVDTATYRTFYANPISLLTSSKKGLNAKAALDFFNIIRF